ncbi:hypothetical protein [Nonomuraea salmonea]|uniref:hypothetical protein n=1 Tax=Nonomuraea salmonea TaxID=46181 RepID=UPI0031E619F9
MNDADADADTDTARLRAAARELVDVALTVQDAAAHATSALTGVALPHALPACGALLRATTNGRGGSGGRSPAAARCSPPPPRSAACSVPRVCPYACWPRRCGCASRPWRSPTPS